jgi:pilus assembly protein CpaC
VKIQAVLAAALLALAAGAQGAPAPIEVKVEVTEVDETRAASLGVQWAESADVAEAAPAGVFKIGRVDRVTSLRSTLRFLIQEGAAELLANPNLITDSGTTATFSAGGEIPYVTSSSLGSTNVEFKPYGVALSVEPKLLADGAIQMKVTAGVSAPDNANGVLLSGNTVPALSERQVTSRVTVAPGATMTLAGLLQTHRSETTHGVPVLRRIPLLGALFRWKRKNFRRTTVVVFVTPRLVEF